MNPELHSTFFFSEELQCLFSQQAIPFPIAGYLIPFLLFFQASLHYVN